MLFDSLEELHFNSILQVWLWQADCNSTARDRFHDAITTVPESGIVVTVSLSLLSAIGKHLGYRYVPQTLLRFTSQSMRLVLQFELLKLLLSFLVVVNWQGKDRKYLPLIFDKLLICYFPGQNKYVLQVYLSSSITGKCVALRSAWTSTNNVRRMYL